MKSRILFLLAACTAAVLSCSNPASDNSGSSDTVTYDVVINEFMVNNDITTGILDPQGEAEDWVELYNNGATAVNLSALCISDDPENPAKQSLPDTVLQPGGYYVAWGGDDNIGFGFSTNTDKGEKVILADSDGTIVDSYAYLTKVAAYVEGRSYGRTTDGADAWGQQATPTPGAANGSL